MKLIREASRRSVKKQEKKYQKELHDFLNDYDSEDMKHKRLEFQYEQLLNAASDTKECSVEKNEISQSRHIDECARESSKTSLTLKTKNISDQIFVGDDREPVEDEVATSAGIEENRGELASNANINIYSRTIQCDENGVECQYVSEAFKETSTTDLDGVESVGKKKTKSKKLRSWKKKSDSRKSL
mmetsp:Transcript_42/g.97  ORF Transcript_42/g.97 Transcript_42/m.97 type:complete len:186 (+) Transcript_42:43-600(+)|eukprot:CAMPEP_0195527282 /NCGR_PEP_ID=MMETSP0794_2-20130614/28845_1 /TAXON_ID=515487 /ORGANISM="Stephanopyxis turris, Strain CCMP 815" /LENGTH=185 /DNA_ID=CAMNT_0040658163 /DNA_START=43 /DNA_END=600 /DNA_ORIENTATION=-